MSRARPEPHVWRQPDVLAALAVRDIGSVYRKLQRVGVTQRQIAALTGQSQSEISEILGGRQVVSYDVLVRIADGLGVPRGHLGLAHDEMAFGLVPAPPPVQDPRSGRWIVRLPVLVDTYSAAVQLAESVASSPVAVASSARDDSHTNERSDRTWQSAARSALTGWR